MFYFTLEIKLLFKHSLKKFLKSIKKQKIPSCSFFYCTLLRQQHQKRPKNRLQLQYPPMLSSPSPYQKSTRTRHKLLPACSGCMALQSQASKLSSSVENLQGLSQAGKQTGRITPLHHRKPPTFQEVDFYFQSQVQPILFPHSTEFR